MNKEIKERIETINNGNVPTELIKSEIGLLPVDWATVTLNDIADALTQTAGKESYETVSISAGIGFVNQAKKFGKELSGKQYEKYIVLHKGDFSYNKGNSKTYPQGCIYRLKDRETAAVPNVFESFRIKSGCADYYDQLFTSGFLNKQLSRKINHGIRDDGLLNLTGKDFYSCVLPFPPVEEQDKIAEILSRCDTVIEECEKQVEEYKSLKKTCLSKMFPKKGSNVPEIRFPGFTDAWEQRKLGEVCSEIGDGLHSAPIYDDNGKYYFINGNNLVNGTIQIDDMETKKVSSRIFEKNDKHLDETTVLLSINGTIGNLAYYEGENVMLGKSTAYLKAKNIDKSFLFTSLQTSSIMSNFMLSLTGTTIKNLGLEAIKKTSIQVPEKDEQIKIGLYFSNLDNLITLHQRKADAYTQMKKALTQLLLTGIVRVNKQKGILP